MEPAVHGCSIVSDRAKLTSFETLLFTSRSVVIDIQQNVVRVSYSIFFNLCFLARIGARFCDIFW
jgi:hypothetical protein